MTDPKLKPRQFKRIDSQTISIMNNKKNIYTHKSEGYNSFTIEDLLEFLGYKRVYDLTFKEKKPRKIKVKKRNDKNNKSISKK